MKLVLTIERGDMGNLTGVARTTITGLGEVYILFDPRRMPDPTRTRDLIVAQIDVALTMMALADGRVEAEHMDGAIEVHGFHAEWAEKDTEA